MRINGPFHNFISLPNDDLGHNYMSYIQGDHGAVLADDVLMEIFPMITEVESYNPSTQKKSKGFNTTGPTMFQGRAIEALITVLNNFLEKTEKGPGVVKIGQESIEKIDLIEHMKVVRDYLGEAVEEGLNILHLGV